MRTSFRQWLPDLAAWRRLLTPLAGWRWTLQRHGMPEFPLEDEAPLRAELFSAEQMAQYGRQLAATHQLAAVRTPDPLLARLAANEETLLEVCKLLTITVSARHRISPAAEWLLDNFYLIEEQIRTARRHLPKGYSRELPCLAAGNAAASCHPRVYDIALEIVTHSDSRVDGDSLRRFVAAYQSVTPLQLGELWAIPIMLRLAVIENLRRVAVRIAAGWSARNLADSWADQMREAAEKDPKSLILVVADMARSNPPMISTFVAELARRLQGRGPALALPLTWIAQRLSESGFSIEQLVQSENQQQAADQVTISNSIGSLRALGALNWRDFVESMSAVEQVLQQDPYGVYGLMDFATRDRYRHAVEAIAKRSALSEVAVAQLVVTLARGVAVEDLGRRLSEPSSHVGYYLIGNGLPQLERAAAVRFSLLAALCHAGFRHALPLFLGGIALLTALFSGLLLWQAQASGLGLWPLLLLGLLATLSTSQLAVTLMNWLATLTVTPHLLPRMDFSHGLPPTARTLVVIPTMLSNDAGVDSLLEGLEVRFLANRSAHLHFGLLTDLCDAASEVLPGDAALIARAQAGIVALNHRYATATATATEGEGEAGELFFLFHRPRRWNAEAGVWMGYERKRGKLADLNTLLRSTAASVADSGFALVEGARQVLNSVKYVITLDTDTQLPRDAAQQFVAAMAHPLNQPHYDARKRCVVAGYGILQPRVAVSLPSTNRSRYARLYGGDTGIDPYTRAVSDVYQDVFGEGSFIGKGIYDVDMFALALDGRFPENRVLSHDLLEGCYLRAGLLSDVQLYEDYPARYSADVSRRYRWIRGDWQLVSWLRRKVPDATQASCSGKGRPCQANPLSVLSQWKLLDNLRRSLTPGGLMLLLLFGWLLLPAAGLWTLSVIGVMLVTSLSAAILDLFRKPQDVLLRQHLQAVVRVALRHMQQVAFELACLPFEAAYSLGAATRTLWRVLVSRRRLLEWNPSSEVERLLATRDRSSLAASYRSMWQAPGSALVVAALLLRLNPAVLPVALPLLLLWLAAPLLAWWLSRPLSTQPPQLTAEQTRFLRQLSRRTWAFFARYVTAADHWLPPDNVQASRADAIAHRTSPTNIGLALLANLAAHDFGYIPSSVLLERSDNTLRSMLQLARHRGHFYNWYDTQTLQPLPPLYVSSVDSGNLAAHLLVLRAGLLALADAPLLPSRLLDGLGDTLLLLAGSGSGASAARAGQLYQALDDRTLTANTPLAALQQRLQQLQGEADELVALAARELGSGSDIDAGNEAHDWALALQQQCQQALDQLLWLAPWLALPPPPPGLDEVGLPDTASTLQQLATPQQDIRLPEAATPAQRSWLAELQQALATGQQHAALQLQQASQLAQLAGELAQMDYDFLFDPTRKLLSIGYNVSDGRSDAGFYDLLASEARLSSFVAIAQGQLPQDSWFALGRLLTGSSGEPVLLSWSGSMFEYLMPLLVMPSYEHTLLDQTCKGAVARQIQYGAQRGVPWGVSESGYNAVDPQRNYQYHAFGVPGLGLKRGLADDLVIAPYAAVMALMLAPEAACSNLQRLAAEGVLGRDGFFEAVDYTPLRQLRGQTRTVVRSFMAHHQGMSLLALAHWLLAQPMQRRFVADPLLQSSLLLLQERVPKATALFAHHVRRFDAVAVAEPAQTPTRRFTSPQTPAPAVQLLSNGRYHVMLTQAGGGYSRWKGLAVSRWNEDPTCDNWGSFCYIRDLASGVFWSGGFQPTLKQPEQFEAIFSEGRAEYRRHDTLGANEGHFETYTEIVVSPEDDIELRRLRITNRSAQPRELDITSYAEVVIAPPVADALHPAFSKLFVQSEILAARHAILCTRRPRAQDEAVPYLLHLMQVHGVAAEMSYETDRLRFIGRGRSTVSPAALHGSAPLSGSDGAVLDPIVAIRGRLILAPQQAVTVDLVTGMADSRSAAEALIDKYQDRHLADRVFDLAWTHNQVMLRQLNASETEAQLYGRLAGAILYAHGALRASPAILASNRRSQSGLWGYAISGDLPIVLLQIADAANIALVRQLVQAHSYWRLKGLPVDLVIWNEDHAGYRQQLQEQILGLIAAGVEASVIDRPGGIFVRSAEHISAEDRILLQAVARVVLSDSRGTLAEQLEQIPARLPLPAPLLPAQRYRPVLPASPEPPPRKLLLDNGLGGFSADGREYVIRLRAGQSTPAPWVNVLANEQFGTVLSESGAGYTWYGNAHEYRLSPWHNDPVSDASGEAIYLRDEESGHFWSPTPLPACTPLPYVIRHGFGYSVFETVTDGIESALWVYVASDAAVKFSVLKLRNVSGRARRLSVTGYVEWVLGDLRAKSALHVATEIAPQSGALYARNVYNSEFAALVAFFDVDDSTRKLTADRGEFLGRNGCLRHPAALQRSTLSGKVGAGLDPCAAMQLQLTLQADEGREVIFRLGVGRSSEEAAALVQRYRGSDAARLALDAVRGHWLQTLGVLQVQTPDASLNVLANGWLLYQTLACRVWARSGYYQSGGAFGFRDQLQDMMALVYAAPARVCAHLLLCASRQFREGDVQHWWHPPLGRGVRTRCSDDYLWLPLAVCRYITVTGDAALLGESVLFLEGRPLTAEEDSYYDLPGGGVEAASLYRHCVLAIRHGGRLGVHGLPLIGSGDWNDGMDRVGVLGRGESVWLGFFLCEVLRQFAPLARGQGDTAFADECEAQRARLAASLATHGWDGAWYRRAYFDDGTPLGSASNEECRIDSISQSWAVLSGVADAARGRQAMDEVYRQLVRPEAALVQLLDPPFDHSSLYPGYIRGYVPGVRENGGQYTHGAIWAAMAFAAQGDQQRTWALLSMINPLQHSRNAAEVQRYKVEPYVMAADVYAMAPHTGRGGWSWYTGSAGWMYRLILESVLGLTLHGARLRITPCLPPAWPGYTLTYRYHDTPYRIEVQRAAVAGITLDGVPQAGDEVLLQDDGQPHQLLVNWTPAP
ncbi:GH36-type glycosyl hydrolase domain-containing protein [Vogesella indigofera]|uniref:Glucoamylase family protein n=1 Tax=Vogesella indigofera TaxID=45465 RepID=A0ABT5I2H0_VOGIN|nr:glucoamylase family protein [Vogesella indigofera]MDC7690362.1 glucoamylase family protein [Vogesella indigofera]